MWYMTANKVPPHFAYPPGYLPVPAQVRILRGAALDQHAALKSKLTVDGLIEAGILMAGTPDQVYPPDQDVLPPRRRLRASADHGPGRLPRARRHGAGIRTFAREVYPRLKEEFPDTAISGVRQERVVA